MVREPPAQMFNTTKITPKPKPSPKWVMTCPSAAAAFFARASCRILQKRRSCSKFCILLPSYIYVRPPALCSQNCQQYLIGEGLSITNMIPHFQRKLWYLAVVGQWSVPLGLSSNGGSAPSATKRKFNQRAKNDYEDVAYQSRWTEQSAK